MITTTGRLLVSALAVTLLLPIGAHAQGTVAAHGSRAYDEYDTPKRCGTSCHVSIYRQWEQAMMSQAYTHHWDEIEYFELAVKHGQVDPDFDPVQKGCQLLTDILHALVSDYSGDGLQIAVIASGAFQRHFGGAARCSSTAASVCW